MWECAAPPPSPPSGRAGGGRLSDLASLSRSPSLLRRGSSAGDAARVPSRLASASPLRAPFRGGAGDRGGVSRRHATAAPVSVGVGGSRGGGPGLSGPAPRFVRRFRSPGAPHDDRNLGLAPLAPWPAAGLRSLSARRSGPVGALAPGGRSGDRAGRFLSGRDPQADEARAAGGPGRHVRSKCR